MATNFFITLIEIKISIISKYFCGAISQICILVTFKSIASIKCLPFLSDFVVEMIPHQIFKTSQQFINTVLICSVATPNDIKVYMNMYAYAFLKNCNLHHDFQVGLVIILEFVNH